jgi:hypothetical protein
MSMTSKERYRINETYRTDVIARVNKNHELNKNSHAYKELIKARKRRWQLTESIANFRYKISLKHNELHRLKNKIEKLELKWGAERAARKRNGKI